MKNLSIVSIGLLLAPAAFAQDDMAPSPFDRLDANEDGQISVMEAEASPTLLERFASLDTNSDGLLSQEEFAAFLPGR